MTDRDEKGRFIPGNDAGETSRFDEGHQRALKHGARKYQETGQLPAERQGFDVALTQDLLDHAGGDPAFALLAQSAARRATILELAYSWLSREDVQVFWLEDDEYSGQRTVKVQPILKWLGSYHEGLRRDLDVLGLTPVSRAKLGLGDKKALDYDELVKELKKDAS